MRLRVPHHVKATLHESLRLSLRERIRSGHWQVGHRLPSERTLAQTYKVSVITVRRALGDLVLEGLLVRRAPAGTFVADPRSRPHVLGVAAFGDQVAASPFFGPMLAGIQEAAAGIADLRLLASGRDASHSSLGDWLKQIAAEGEEDGLIAVTAGPVGYEDVAHLEVSGLPYVLLNRRVPGHPVWCAVLDDYGVGRQAVDYLSALGHRHIVHLAGPASLVTVADRVRGFLDALALHQLTPPGAEPPVAYGPFTYGAEPTAAIQRGCEGMRALLARRPRPTAVFAGSDSLAIGAYRAIREAGLRVPEDVSVIGMMNSATSAAMDPPLTTFDYGREEIGRQAVRLLLDQIEGRAPRGTASLTPEARMRVVPAALVERSSCAPAPLAAGRP